MSNEQEETTWPFEPESLQESVRRLLFEGKKIMAVKLYREQTGVGLREAKDAVEQFESQLALSGVSDSPNLEGSQQASAVVPVGDDVLDLLLRGYKIQAIKLYREQTGLGLREAKNAVEQSERQLALSGVSYSPDVERSQRASAVVPVGDDVLDLLLRGYKIQAIKLYRSRTGLGLREAKKAIDLAELRLRQG